MLQLDRLAAAVLTPWPDWVYNQYDAEWLMCRVRRELIEWNFLGRNAPREPIAMSYWLAANLPLDDGLQCQLLAMDSVISRLRAAISIMKRVGT